MGSESESAEIGEGMIVRSGDYNYIIDVEPLIPPIAGGIFRYVASVREIVRPRIGGPQRFPVEIGECWGATESEARASAKSRAEDWIRSHQASVTSEST